MDMACLFFWQVAAVVMFGERGASFAGCAVAGRTAFARAGCGCFIIV